MKALSGVDGAFLHLETPETPMHVASLHLLDLPAGHDGDFHAELKRQMARRIHLAPIFTRKLAPMPLQFANPVWVADEQVDLDYHVQRITLRRPGTAAQFEDCAGRLHAELLDRSRPLWRMVVIDGLRSGQVGLYIKVHHAVLDGQAGVLLSSALFDLTATPRRLPRGTASHAEHPGMAELAAAALKHDVGQYIKLLRHLPGVVTALAGLLGPPAKPGRGKLGENFSFGPKTPLNVPISGERGFAAWSVPLDTLKQLATVHQAKLNDIVLALCSAALRRYLEGHGGVPKKPLIATMPISLREAGNVEYTTQATLSLVNLHTHIADPVKRLRAIRDAAGAVKDLARHARGLIPTDFPSIGVPWLLRAFAALYGSPAVTGTLPPIANVVISNVPGPQVPLYAAGARVASYWPLSIVEHGLGLNITVMSYAGAMGFGFTTARTAVPDARALSAALHASLDELVAASRTAPRRRRGAATDEG
ncbi:wax ester/triacylglycerol synthase family O-acyltransferase [uncultured Piscinibacter sp.]|mgnify:CR=1 FL=1|uniref:wax ester/triacylglycerol synthase family O-acyltransferase n=1 Tax=uncultured Piscinibacter sp. TaxID=1131835 RepID=UPI00261725C3|nr:wax ester/triacylglycerol synthase family O-acyltransferase [uncultured Piscinibacter sp.]